MPYPFQIVQSEEAIFFSYEYADAAWNSYLQGPGEAPLNSWMGPSYRYWQGDTSVIEVTGQNDATWLDRAGKHHSTFMSVVERFSPTMRYEVETVDQRPFSTLADVDDPLSTSR